MCTFATGNVQHDYYQILIIPSLAIIYALGSDFLIQKFNGVGKVAVIIITVGMLTEILET